MTRDQAEKSASEEKPLTGESANKSADKRPDEERRKRNRNSGKHDGKDDTVLGDINDE